MRSPEEVAREVLGCHLIDTDGGPGLPDYVCETTGHEQWDCAVEEGRLAALIRARDTEVRADEGCTCGFGGVHEEMNPRCALNQPTKEERTMPDTPVYVLDIYLKSGTVMRGVTVSKFEYRGSTVTWTGAGEHPLVYISPDDIAGVVCTNGPLTAADAFREGGVS